MSVANPFQAYIRLDQPRLGSRVVHASDDFFGAKERLIDPVEPVFIADKYDEHGKWMDGWESRRRRTPGHDFAVIRLGIPGVVRGVDIDTSHFTGNYPPEASIDACISEEENPEEGWEPLLARTRLEADSHHYLPVDVDASVTHLRLNIFPDGGVARLRVYGEVRPLSFDEDEESGMIDLFALRHGGRALAASDAHFGSMHNLNLPGRGINMGDGWETARRRGPGNDWVIVALGRAGTVERAEIDTGHFKGNYPDHVVLEGGSFDSNEAAQNESDEWRVLLPEAKLSMDQQHFFETELEALGSITHVRMSIFPDGGISRLRLFGHASEDDE